MSKILEVKHVTKLYPGVVALDDVSFDVEEGEILALIGENGAGKSTVIKTIAGAIQPEKGTIVIDGKEYTKLTPALAKSAGIGVVYQEFNLVPSLSIAENVFLGDRVGTRKGMPDFKEMKKRAEEILADLGVKIDVSTQVQMLSTAQMQIVEIAKALVKNCRVLIMDEPSASIPMAEVGNMFRIVRKLKERGVSVIYISHRLEELFELCDRVTVFRDGKYVVTRNVADITKKDLIKYMIGRELTEKFPERNVKIGEPVLEVRDLTGNGDFHIDLTLHKGEILGLAGLVGAGRTELAKMVCGDVKPEHGEIIVRGKAMNATSVADAVDLGIGLIPEDRKQEGAFLEYSIEWNIPVMSLRRNSRRGLMNFKALDKLVDKYIRTLDIKTPTAKQLVRNLSGGNQQKVVVAKVLAADTDILIFDEPTRGIDVGAKQEIYKLMNRLVEEGKSILMISSEMEEMLGMSDRILVLHEGRISGEVLKNEFTQEKILELASGIVEE
ncbi:MAG: sugar ABC transporter ATP-binding protein [Lachnospiraceae bacterium]|nr:sugar ABC transporter ATP-binding protein [Lachnospiraceae bacterium]